MQQLLRSAALTLVLIPGLATLLHAGDVVFDFDNPAPSSSTTPLSVTVNGLTATFTSSPDAGGFMVLNQAGFFSSLTGNFLIDSAPETLTISFSSPQASISLDFATGDDNALNLSASLLGSPVGTQSATGTIPAGFDLPEGVLTFSGGTFDTVVLSSATPSFAIDNIDVNDGLSSPAPEPGSLLLCGGALAALSFLRRRRRVA
jgi:hypothetical protein